MSLCSCEVMIVRAEYVRTMSFQAVLPAVFRGVFAGIRWQELPLRYSSRVDIGIGFGGGRMVDMPPYHHTLLVPQKARLD